PSEGLHDKTILNSALLLSDEIDNTGLGGDLLAQSVANVLTIHVLRNYAEVVPRSLDYVPPGLDRARLRRVLDFVEANLGAPLSLDVLASTAAVSPYHFARGFKLATGYSPHQWVIHRRIERAKILLRSTRLPIADVAHQVGMSNHSHFITRFRRV